MFFLRLDEALFRFINNGLSNPVFDFVMPLFSAPPPVKLSLLAAAVVFAWKGGRRAWLCLALIGAALLIGEELFYSPLKNLIERPRPYEALPDVHLLVGRGRPNQSMPSSHVANCVAAVVILAFYYRRSLRWLLPVALVTAFSRIYVGAHYPADVILAALLGSVIGAGLIAVTRCIPASVAQKPPWQRLGLAWLAFVLLATVAYIASGRIQLCEDEAYQWLWAKHLDWSYYSKPPLIAWAQALSTFCLGDNELGVRFFAPLCAAAAACLMLLMLSKEANPRAGFRIALVATATPLLAGCGFLFLPDSLAIFFWTATLFAGWRAMQAHSVAWWIVTGFLLGLGLLTKQAGAAQLASFVIFFIVYPPARLHLRRPGFYLAVAVAALCLTPVILWNARHGWIMAAHMESRAGIGSDWSIRYFAEFIAAEFGLLVPVFAIGIAAAAISTWRDKTRSAFTTYLFCMSVPLLLGCAVYSLVARVHPNWPAPAVLPALALMVVTFDARLARLRPWLVAGVGIGLTVIIFGHDTLLIRRLTGYSLPPRIDPLRRVLGWRSAAQVVEEQRQRLASEGAPAFVIGSHYGIASLLTFYTPAAHPAPGGLPSIYCLSSDVPRNQFDLWPGYSSRKGENAIYVIKTDTPQEAPRRLYAEFESVTDLGLHPVYDKHRGEIRRLQLYACRGLR